MLIVLVRLVLVAALRIGVLVVMVMSVTVAMSKTEQLDDHEADASRD